MVDSFSRSLYKCLTQEASLTESIDYRHLIRSELVERCRRNSTYSVRAMARDIDVSPAFLSLVLNGRKSISEERATRIGECLRWSTAKQRLFLLLVRFEKTTHPRTREDLLLEISRQQMSGLQSSFFNIDADTFQCLSEWYHFAMVELVELPNAEFTPRWFAKRLSIRVSDAKAALERLIRVGLLKDEDGRLARGTPSYTTTEVPSDAIRRFHRQMLDKARHALDEQDVDARDLSGVTMAIPLDRLPEAKRRIRDFRRDLMTFLESEPCDKQAVYHLALQLFRVDKDTISSGRKSILGSSNETLSHNSHS